MIQPWLEQSIIGVNGKRAECSSPDELPIHGWKTGYNQPMLKLATAAAAVDMLGCHVRKCAPGHRH